MGRRDATLAVLALVLLAGCSAPEASPEEKIRALLTEVERASRDKDLGALRDVISERYADSAGRDKRELDGILTAQYLRRGSVHMLTRIRSLEFPRAAHAEASVLAGLARTPVLDFADLRRPQADIYVFDLELAEEDDSRWRVIRARWRPARPDDLY